ncbi:hypothetical protein B0A50_08254 [Salinomyces thailandicus]|uniref:Uncharacterized protein n=1 Tax=Salinomyces thailandicus TaxID=706561 RepID=A0A4U0TKX8_9PEZI|nr:hypothetical protein B0A50_08254 [Salinomyces thailandica]
MPPNQAPNNNNSTNPPIFRSTVNNNTTMADTEPARNPNKRAKPSKGKGRAPKLRDDDPSNSFCAAPVNTTTRGGGGALTGASAGMSGQNQSAQMPVIPAVLSNQEEIAAATLLSLRYGPGIWQNQQGPVPAGFGMMGTGQQGGAQVGAALQGVGLQGVGVQGAGQQGAGQQGVRVQKGAEQYGRASFVRGGRGGGGAFQQPNGNTHMTAPGPRLPSINVHQPIDQPQASLSARRGMRPNPVGPRLDQRPQGHLQPPTTGASPAETSPATSIGTRPPRSPARSPKVIYAKNAIWPVFKEITDQAEADGLSREEIQYVVDNIDWGFTKEPAKEGAEAEERVGKAKVDREEVGREEAEKKEQGKKKQGGEMEGAEVEA